MGKSKGRKMRGPWRRVAPGRSIKVERRSATTMTCVSLSCRFMFWALKTRARLPHKNTLTSDDEAGSAADTAAERLAPAQVTPSPQSLARMVNILPSFPCCLKKNSSSDRSVMWRNWGQDDRRQMVNGGVRGKESHIVLSKRQQRETPLFLSVVHSHSYAMCSKK